MKITTLSLCFLFAVTSLHAQKALEIASGFENQKIEALQAYLAQNPAATDKGEALSLLVTAYTNLGQFAPIPDLLRQRYDIQDKGVDADLDVIVTQITRPFIEACIASGQKDKAKEFIATVKTDLADHPQGQQVSQFLDQLGGELSLPGVGDEMNISFTDLKGAEIDLTKMHDKVILVDFWATWCGPCIAEMPNVTAAYGAFKEKGFEVIGISLDDDKAAVEQFTAENKMPWPQYFDGKGWENEIARKFGITSIPATFLIGKGGKIVASNLRGPALEKAIEEALASAE